MEPDVVQLPISTRLWAWFEKNKKPSLWGASILVAAGLVIWLVIYQQDQKEVAASEALSDVALTPLNGLGSRPDPAEAYLKIAAAYPNSSAGIRASLLAAGSLFTEGKVEEAKMQFQKFTRERHDSPFMGQALLGIAACLDAQNKTNEATAAYKDLIERHPSESFVPQAKFALARLYEAQNRPELALNCFEEAAQADPYGSVGSEAGMRAEELKIKYPALAPKAPAPMATAPPVSMTPGSVMVTTGTVTGTSATTVPAVKIATNAVSPAAGALK